MCCLTGSTRYFHVLVAALHKGCKSKLLAEGNCKVLWHGRGWSVGFFTVAIPEAEGPRLRKSGPCEKPIKSGGCFFYADVDDGPPLFALAMPLVSCSREKRLFGI